MPDDNDIFVAMPVFRGGDVLAETLRCLKRQTYAGFRAVLSLDEPDADTSRACAAVADDGRFSLVTQRERRGWPGNLNWLLQQVREPFFVYWQQDDFASDNYLELLRQALVSHPGAAVAFTDVQHFGAETRHATLASVAGSPPERVLQQFEDLNYLPLRGLMRTSMLQPDRPAIPDEPGFNVQAEFLFLAAMAARGDFLRVPDGLYFKRDHARSVSLEWRTRSAESRRRQWAWLGARYLPLLSPPPPGLPTARTLALILDRLAIARPGRGFWYGPLDGLRQIRALCLLLAHYAGLDLSQPRWSPAALPAGERPVHPFVRQALQAEHERAQAVLTGPPRLPETLGWGWQEPEAWGAWSDGEHASLELGSWPGGRLVVQGRVFAPGGSVRIGCSWAGEDTHWLERREGEPLRLELEPPAGAARIELHLPDAVSPAQAAVAADPRRICLGVEGLVRA